MAERQVLRLLIALSFVAAILLIGSCTEPGPDPVSKGERLDKFFADINEAAAAGGTSSDYQSVYKNTHPDATKRDQSKDGVFWETNFGGTGYAILSTSDVGDIRTVNFTSSLGEDTMRFEMQEDDPDVWMIRRIDTTNNGSFADGVDFF